jgi:hypothetical protein
MFFVFENFEINNYLTGRKVNIHLTGVCQSCDLNEPTGDFISTLFQPLFSLIMVGGL